MSDAIATGRNKVQFYTYDSNNSNISRLVKVRVKRV